MRRRRLLLPAVIGLLASACAHVPARLDPPEVRSVEARVIAFSFPMLRLGIDLTVRNPNPVDVSLARLDVALDVEGESVARTLLAQPVTLPARADAVVSLDTSGNLGAAIAGVARSLDRRGAPLRYELRGQATLDSGQSFPFVRRGELAWR